MLKIENGIGGYDTTVIIQDINVEIKAGEQIALLGRNGVGKTTFLKYIMGLLNLNKGNIFISGSPLDNQPISRAKAGIGYVPQGRYVFEKLSVMENIEAVAYANNCNHKEAIEMAFSFFPILKEHRHRNAGSLSGGQQQILAIARAMALKPKIMLLDEPSEGIQPSIIQDIGEVLKKLSSETNMTLIIAEQNLDFCMSIANRALIMLQGSIAKQATKEELNKDKELLKDLLAI